jgi:hypothetical protein
MKKILFSCLILSGILSCQSGKQKDLAGVIAYANIEKHIAELSSDKYLGRMPMSSTEKPVVDYIASQMKEIGLEPANNGSYFQEVPILKVTSKISTFLRFKTPGGSLDIPKIMSLLPGRWKKNYLWKIQM